MTSEEGAGTEMHLFVNRAILDFEWIISKENTNAISRNNLLQAERDFSETLHSVNILQKTIRHYV